MSDFMYEKIQELASEILKSLFAIFFYILLPLWSCNINRTTEATNVKRNIIWN